MIIPHIKLLQIMMYGKNGFWFWLVKKSGDVICLSLEIIIAPYGHLYEIQSGFHRICPPWN